MVREGHTKRLNSSTYPNCLLHRSDPSDVARTEKVTFICTDDREAAGPTNNWMAPADSPQSRIGVELSDSAYVVANMRIMSRIGRVALDRLGNSSDFVPGLHS